MAMLTGHLVRQDVKGCGSDRQKEGNRRTIILYSVGMQKTLCFCQLSPDEKALWLWPETAGEIPAAVPKGAALGTIRPIKWSGSGLQ